MTLGQAVTLLETVESGSDRLAAYVVLSLLSGVRTEEARAITWDEVDLKAGTVTVYRPVRVKGDTKTAVRSCHTPGSMTIIAPGSLTIIRRLGWVYS